MPVNMAEQSTTKRLSYSWHCYSHHQYEWSQLWLSIVYTRSRSIL